jgi:hypothetical protein
MNLNPNHLRFHTISLTITLPSKIKGKIILNSSDDGHLKYTIDIHYDGSYNIYFP